jgi:FixJ family two-component response regulator
MTMAPAPVVHLVDDDESLRTALTRLLDAAGYQVRAYASAGEFLLGDPADGPSCLLLDVRMPGPSGLELQQALMKRGNAPAIVFLTGHGDIPMSVRAMRAGAVDFLTKPVKKDALLQAVEMALARHAELSVRRDEIRVIRSRFEALTPREREVFAHVVAGLPNKLVADAMGCALRTVKIHRARVMQKMAAASLADLVRMAETLRDAAPSAGPA